MEEIQAVIQAKEEQKAMVATQETEVGKAEKAEKVEEKGKDEKETDFEAEGSQDVEEVEDVVAEAVEMEEKARMVEVEE